MEWPWLRSLIGKCLGVWIEEPQLPFGWSGINSVDLNRLSYGLWQRHQLKIGVGEIISSRSPAGLLSRLRRNDTREAVKTLKAPVLHRDPGAHMGAPRPNHAPRDIDACEIAIVGMHADLPGAENLAQFWDQQLQGTCVIGHSQRSYLSADFQAGFLQRIDGFDHTFFRISPREATQMDPRQRRLLHSVWCTLEDAGYAMSQLAGTRTGCYVGATGSDYQALRVADGVAIESHWQQGISAAMLSNRLSHFFDWSGPSLTLDTACSSSFAALIRACTDLRNGLCDHALVAASNLLMDDRVNRALMMSGFLSPNYRCAAFSDHADGYVRGEATVSIMLKRRADAERDQDHILGLVLACGENHGGRTASLTAPSADAQVALLQRTYDRALASRVGYIETHGTGTLLGDMIECRALNSAWESLLGRRCAPLPLGAIKRSIGHAEAAAGLASLVRVLLSMRHGVVPRYAPIAGSKLLADLAPAFQLPPETLPWTCDGPRVAGISTFGFGGHNAHVVIEQALQPEPVTATGAPDEPMLFVVSGHSPSALAAARAALAQHLKNLPEGAGPLRNVAANLAYAREHFRHRAAHCARTRAELMELLDRPLRPAEGVQEDAAGSLIRSVQRAYLEGQAVDWSSLFPRGRGRAIRLPTYPFEEQSHWYSKTPA